jgi:hypothetical protein
MHEYKHGQLKSGGKRKVKNPKQAIAIALSEARRSGASVPPKKKGAAKKKSGASKTAGRKTAAKRAPSRKKTAAKRSSARKRA